MAKTAEVDTKATTEVTEEKKARNYRGKAIAIKDAPANVPVERIGPNPVYKDKWGMKVNLPRFFMLKQVSQHTGQAMRHVDAVSHKDGARHSVYVPPELEVKLLTGLQGKAVADKYAKFIESNFDQHIYYPLSTMTGADPEFFVEHGNRDLFPAFEFLKAQDDPGVHRSRPSSGGGCANKVYWDGFQAEFQVTALNCLGWVCDSIQSSMTALILAAREKDPKAKLSTKTLIDVPMEVLGKTDPRFVAFGCKPSFNAYDLKSELDKPGNEVGIRSTGGHIHFGIGNHHSAQTFTNIVKALDAIIGVGCVSMFAEFDHPLRRRFYGLPGEYRLPKHGLEYRTLSNAWLFHPFLTNLVIDTARRVTNLGYNDLLKVWDHEEKETVETILYCDVDRARKILDRNKSVLDKIWERTYGKNQARKACWKAMRYGLESVIKDPSDVVGNWGLVNGKYIAHCDAGYMNVYHGSEGILEGKKI